MDESVKNEQSLENETATFNFGAIIPQTIHE